MTGYVRNCAETCGLSGRMNVVPVVDSGRDNVGKSKASSGRVVGVLGSEAGFAGSMLN